MVERCVGKGVEGRNRGIFNCPRIDMEGVRKTLEVPRIAVMRYEI
jgi:hypothetical protein